MVFSRLFGGDKDIDKAKEDIILYLKNGKSMDYAIEHVDGFNKKEVKKWYRQGRKGKRQHEDFYNSCYPLVGDSLIEEDIELLSKLIKEDNKFFKHISDFALNDPNIYNPPEVIKQWYLLGRAGNAKFKSFYKTIYHHAFDDLIKKDVKTIMEILNKDENLDEALSSDELFVTKEQFRLWYLNSDNNDQNYKKLNEKYNHAFKVKSQNTLMDYYEKNLKIDSDIQGLYHTVDEILSWYREIDSISNTAEDNADFSDTYFYNTFRKLMISKTNFFKSEVLLKKIDMDVPLDITLKKISLSENNLNKWLELAKLKLNPFYDFSKRYADETKYLDIITYLKKGNIFNSSMPYYEDAKRWYNLGSNNLTNKRFFDVASNILIKNTDFEKSQQFLDNLNLDSSIDKNLKDLNIPKRNFENWLQLAKMQLSPFKEFAEEYDEFMIKYNFIKSLKSGGSFNQSIPNFKKLKKWYRLGSKQNIIEDKFYEEVFNLIGPELIKNDLNIIESLHKKGNSFDEAISYKELFHDKHNFFSWYKKGEFDDSIYKEVYDLFNRLFNDDLIEHDTKIVKNYLKTHSFKESLQCDGLYYNSDELKLKYKDSNNLMFNEEERDLINKETMANVISAIKKGSSFNSLIPDVYYNFDVIKKWYVEGSKGDERFEKFYNSVSKLLVENTHFDLNNHVLQDVKSKISLDDMKIDNVSKKDVSDWINYGKQGLKPFSGFYKDFIEIYFANLIEEGNSFDQSLVLIKRYISPANIKKWYEWGKEGNKSFISFYNSLNSVLINVTNFSTSKVVLSNLNLNKDILNEVDKKTYDNIKQWCHLAKLDFTPFLDFYSKFKKYQTQYKIIQNIKLGKSFEEALALNCNDFKEDEIKKWYNDKNSEFYEISSKLTEGDSQKIILEKLRKGFSFDESIKMSNLHDASTIKKWYDLGKLEDDEYKEFYKSCYNLIVLNTQKTVIESLSRGKSFEEAIHLDSLEIDSNKIKKWYVLGRNGDEEYKDFYTYSFSFIINSLKEDIIAELKNEKSFKELLNNKFKFFKDDIIDAYVLGREENDEYENFYKDISSAIESEIKLDVISYLDNVNIFDESFEIPSLEFCSHDIKKWCELGSQGDEQHEPFFNDCYILVNKNLKEDILSKIKEGKSFEEANNSIFSNKIKIDYALGNEGDLRQKEFYEKCNKLRIINTLENNSFDDLYDIYDEIKTFAVNDDEFESQARILLIDNTNFETHEEVLSKISISESLENINENVSSWTLLGKEGFAPFDMFYNKYLIHQDKFVIFSYLNEGNYLKDIISNENLNHGEEEIKQWYNLGKNGQEEFIEFYSSTTKLLEKDTQRLVLDALKSEMPFEDAIAQDILFHDSENIKEWYMGDNRKTEYSKFYNGCLKFMENEYMDIVVDLLNNGKTFEDAINQDNLRPFAEDIKKWFALGEDISSKYNHFHMAVEKASIINALKNNENPILLNENYPLFKEYYLNDGEFKRIVEELLIKVTNYSNASKVIDEFNFDELYELNNDSDAYIWSELSKDGFDLFDEFYSDYLIYKIQFNVISYLKKGLYLVDIPTNEDISVDRSTIEKWYDLGKSSEEFVKFYNESAPLLEKDSQKMIINKLKGGATFKDALEMSGLYHSTNDVKNWIELGKQGNKEYIEFYETCQNYRELEDQQLVIGYLDEGMLLDEAINQKELLFNSDEIKKWYILGRDNSKYKNFYVDATKKIFINLISNDVDFFNAFDSLELESSKSDILNWYGQGSENFSIHVDFYNAVKDRLIKAYEFNTSNKLLEDLDSNLDGLKNSYIDSWIKLSNLNIKPFDEFYNKFSIYENQGKVIELIENKNMIFEDAIKDSSLNYSSKEIRGWYDLGKEGDRYTGFFNKIKSITKMETQNKVIDNLSNGMMFESAISKNDLIHTSNEIMEWYNLGKGGESEYVTFYQKVVVLIEKDSQHIVNMGLKEGMSFSDAINQDNLYHTANEIEEWYYAGLNGNEKYNQFYKNSSKYLIFETQRLVLEYLDNGMSFEEAISQKNLFHKPSVIKEWYYAGLKDNDKYRNFSIVVSKSLFKYAVDNDKKSVDDLFDEFDFDNILTWFLSDEEFSDKYFDLLIEYTKFNDFEELLLNLNPENSFDEYKNSSTDMWLKLGKQGIEPFTEFYTKFIEFSSQHTIIEEIKKGKSLNQILTQIELPNSKEEIKNWIMGIGGFDKFYEFCQPYAEEASKKMVISVLQNGTSFETAISQDRLFHSSNEIEEWYELGSENDPKHKKFYEETFKYVVESEDDEFEEIYGGR